MTKLEKKFWSKVNIKSDEECWEWTKGARHGYGEFYDAGKIIAAHRFAWEFYHKCKIPEGKLILHRCDNRPCYNPLHLYAGTYSNNAQDMLRRNRGNKHIVAFKLSKISANQITQIRKLLKTDLTQDDIANMMGVPRPTVSRINRSEKYPCKEGFYA